MNFETKRRFSGEGVEGGGVDSEKAFEEANARAGIEEEEKKEATDPIEISAKEVEELAGTSIDDILEGKA